MRVLVVGGSGAVGRPLLPMLVAAGHEVHATTRSQSRAGEIESAGATAEIVDLLESGAPARLVDRVRPDVVIDQLTSLPQDFDPRNLDEAYAANNQIKRLASAPLIEASESAGVRRYILQSLAFLYRPGKQIATEGDPEWLDAPAPFGEGVRLLVENERRVISSASFEGVILRYGFFYGPGTWYETGGSTLEAVRTRQYPLIGAATGIYSLIHVADAASAALAAVDRGSGIYNIVDDDPAPLNELIPEVAAMIDAAPPRRVPAFVARFVAGKYLTTAALKLAGASNDRAKAELGWEPQIASWRTGLRDYRDSIPGG